MSLEFAFECRKTLERLRGGRLAQALEEFSGWLLARGFSRGSIRLHLTNVSHLDEYLSRRNVEFRRIVSSDDIESFFRAYVSQCRNRGSLDAHVLRVRYSINRFLGYLKETGRWEAERQEIYRPLLDGYLQWMSQSRHVSAGTINVRAHSLRLFLAWLGPEATPQGLSHLTPERIERFFLSHAQRMGRAARRSLQSALRTFFRYCLQRGHTQQELERAIPTLRTYKLATVPQGLTDMQAQKIMRAIDRGNAAGRRDYAIVQLLYTYGVRGCQVRDLQFQDVDWQRNEICFKGSKHGKDSRLPLTATVGESLIDYLQNSRPYCSSPHVFLSCRAPYQRLPRSNSLSAIVERHIRSAGIDVARKGSHAFRHGFATRMLEEGHSLKAIADVLGHRHLQTTFIYTKVDFNALKQVALDWPEAVKR
jgi:site-specific recombinase XerD